MSLLADIPLALEEDLEAKAALQNPHFSAVLDIGSGDGNVTSALLPFVDGAGDIRVTEVSPSMRWRLQQRGFTVVDHTDPFHDPPHSSRRAYYDLITCFNLLDRIDTPMTLLREMHASLTPETGRAVLAVVLPWCPFVEDGARQKRPRELLPMRGGECCRGASYEQSLQTLVQNVLEPIGFTVVRWTRLPYLCEGNLEVEYAVLNDALLVLKRTK